MLTSFQSRALALGFAAGLLVAAVLFYHAGPADRPTPQAAAAGKTAEPVPPASSGATPLSAADWMEKIRQTPASGRAGLMRRILEVADEGLRNEVATALALEWMSSDLNGYLAFLDELVVDGGLSADTMKRFSVALMRSFEKVSGKAALEGKMRYIAEVIVNYLIANDPAGAESWVRTFLVGLDLDNALGRLAPAMVAQSPEKALEIFASIKSVAPRLTAAPELGAALSKSNPDAALKWADSISAHSERTMAMGGVVTVMAGSDPARAAAHLKEFLSKIQNEYTQLREKDRMQAGVKAEDEFQTPELYREYLETNGFVLMPPDTPEADYLLKAGEQIGFLLAKTDPAGAIAWAESLAVGLSQAHAISGALSGWSTTAPREAVDYYLKNYGYDAGMPRSLFEHWAGQDPDAAVAAMGGLQNDGQKSSAIQGVTQGWLESENDLGGLIEWVGQLPAGTDRDRANLAVIAQTSDTNPSAAWELVKEISEPTARRQVASDVFSLLAVENPAVARSVLGQYEAPAEELAALGRILSVAEAPR